MQPILAVIAVGALVYRAWSHKSLTPVGIFAAFLTAVAHALHPSALPFTLLAAFFIAGTKATKVKHDIKVRLTMSSGGPEGEEGSRNHIQVLANSGVASVLSLLHVWKLWRDGRDFTCIRYGKSDDILLLGIIANYAAVAADTLSSELGILSQSQPRLITSFNLRKVPRGTNGGVTLTGLLAGSLGALIIGAITALFTSFCPGSSGPVSIDQSGLGQRWTLSRVLSNKVLPVLIITVWGALGSLLDSILGGLFQASVVDKRSGKVVEGSGGRKVMLQPSRINTNSPKSAFKGSDTKTNRTFSSEEAESRSIAAGADILDNNQVNSLMAALMSTGAMVTASWLWEVPLQTIFT